VSIVQATSSISEREYVCAPQRARTPSISFRSGVAPTQIWRDLRASVSSTNPEIRFISRSVLRARSGYRRPESYPLAGWYLEPIARLSHRSSRDGPTFWLERPNVRKRCAWSRCAVQKSTRTFDRSRFHYVRCQVCVCARISSAVGGSGGAFGDLSNKTTPTHIPSNTPADTPHKRSYPTLTNISVCAHKGFPKKCAYAWGFETVRESLVVRKKLNL
jgi:hypothetical protein